MKIHKLKIDIDAYSKYHSLIGELIENNGSPMPRTIDYEISMPLGHFDFFQEKMKILLDGVKNKIYSARENLSKLQINTMLAIAFKSRDDYKELYNNNSESVYMGELIDKFDVYYTLLDQICNSESVKAEFYILNTRDSGKRNKVVVDDNLIKKKTLVYLKEIYRSEILQLSQEIETLFNVSAQAFELLYQCKHIANTDKFNSADKDLNTFVEPLLKLVPKVAELIIDYKTVTINRSKKDSDRQGIYLRNVYSNLQRFLEEETEINTKNNPSLKSSEQHRVIHYICAMAGVTPFQSEIKQQAQIVKDILRIR